MRQYLRLSGIKTGSTRPPVDITDLDRDLGPVPGWRYLLDPEQITDAGAVLNRVDGVAKMPWDTRGVITPPYPEAGFVGGGAFANGRPAVQLREVNRRSIVPDLAFPAAAWSVFAYLRIQTTSTDVQEVIAAAPGTTVAAGQYGPRIGVNPTGTIARIWQRGSGGDIAGDRRLSYEPLVSFVGREVGLLFAFSAGGGLSIYEDGALAAHNPAAGQVLTQGVLAGQWRFFRGMNADLGLTGILDVDLGRADMAGYRTRLFDGLAAHYG